MRSPLQRRPYCRVHVKTPNFAHRDDLLILMAGFGFSITDILAVGTYAWNVYKSCKHAGRDFREIAQDGKLQPLSPNGQH